MRRKKKRILPGLGVFVVIGTTVTLSVVDVSSLTYQPAHTVVVTREVVGACVVVTTRATEESDASETRTTYCPRGRDSPTHSEHTVHTIVATSKEKERQCSWKALEARWFCKDGYHFSCMAKSGTQCELQTP